MTNRLRGTGAAVAAIVLALVLAACGGGTPSADEHGMTTEEHAAWLAEQGQGGGDASHSEHPDSGGAAAEGGQAAEGGGHGGHSGNPGELELWAVQTDVFKTVVTEGDGRIVYRFDRDSFQPSASNCIDEACLSTWEPVLAPPGEVVGLGVDQSKIGTVFRPDGSKQVTLGGWPLYTHAGENGGLVDAGANGKDGVWFAIAPTGDKAATY
jgi:predicted lipoprotein with Yx(FWY)xxD motif